MWPDGTFPQNSPIRITAITGRMEPDPIAKLVLVRLQERGWKIADLAEHTDLHRSVLCKWLSGRRTIRVSLVLRVMRVLDIVAVPREDLVGRDAAEGTDRRVAEAARRRRRNAPN